jgi:amino acid adenylation domain-containing protein
MEGLIGMFVNTLALRTVLDSQDSFAGVLAKVKSTCVDAYANQDTPFEAIVDALQPRRDLKTTPLFQVMFALQNTALEVSAQNIEPFPLERRISKFDLTLEMTLTAQGLRGTIEYCTALFAGRSIERMAAQFTALCDAIVKTPSARITGLDYLAAAEKQQLLQQFNETRVDHPPELCIETLFRQQATLHPEALAVESDGRQLTYAQLESGSRALAVYLQLQGIGPDTVVGLCAERSVDMVVGLLGIVRSGAAYVPLDPAYPEERLAYMLQDSHTALVLTQEKLVGRLRALSPANVPLLSLDGDWQRISAAADAGTELRQLAGPHHLAYVIYTSGSTGKPKGAAVYRRGLNNLLQWYLHLLDLSAEDRVLVVTSSSFDLTQKNLLGPLLRGASVHLGPESFEPMTLAQLIQADGITFMNLTPGAFDAIVAADSGAALASLQHVMLGGEPINAVRMAELQRRYPHARVINTYGPTECADVCAYHVLERRDLETRVIPIGRPVPYTRLYVLDAQRNPVPIGVAGEIYVGGVGVGAGYLNQPQRTAERFGSDPFGVDPQGRRYATGDLGRWLEEGNIEYLGRIDSQVKIRGFRIELGEIEARLNEHAQIEDSVVIAQGEESGKRLIAFYRSPMTTADQRHSVAPQELRTHLLQTLPGYMVPAAFISMERIPLSPNGKVDRRALEQTQVQPQTANEYVAPRDETEIKLAQIWAEVLDLNPEKVGVNHSFFELGGNSLLAVQLMAKISRQFGHSLPVAILFEYPDITGLAGCILRAAAAGPDLIVPIQMQGDLPPVFVVPGAGGNVLSLRPLSRTLGNAQPFFGVQAVGLDGKTKPLSSVEQTAEVNIRAIRAVQPRGPYNLMGHSYGGVVAFEMARMLLEGGEDVATLIFLDSLAPAVRKQVPRSDEAGLILEICSGIAHRYPDVQLSLDEQVLRGLDAERRVTVFADALRTAGLDVDEAQLATFIDVVSANESCYHAYEPVPLPREVDVVLYRALKKEGWAAVPEDYGWNQLLQQPLRSVDAVGDHFSMLDEKHVQAVGEAIRIQLTRFT